MADSFTYDLFLSHHYQDKPVVCPLAQRLRDDGLNVWLDDWIIKPEDDLYLTIEAGLKKSRLLVSVVSSRGLGSNWMGLELSAALAQNRPVILILLEKCTIPDSLQQYPTIDFQAGYETAYTQLVQVCRTVHDRSPLTIKVDISRLPMGSTPLVGRHVYLDHLNAYFANPKVAVVSMVAAGGVGKSALVSAWLHSIQPEYGGTQKVFAWSFYSQGVHETHTSSGPFFQAALAFFGHEGEPPKSNEEKALCLGGLLQQQPSLLILDGVEPLQYPTHTQGGFFVDTGLYRLLGYLRSNGLGKHGHNGLVLITSRQSVRELADQKGGLYRETLLDHLSDQDGTQLLMNLGVVKGLSHEFNRCVREMKGHALGLVLLGKLLSQQYEGDIARRDQITGLYSEKEQGEHARRVMAYYDEKLWGEEASHRVFLRLLGLFDRPMEEAVFHVLRAKASVAGLLKRQKLSAFDAMIFDLEKAGLLLMAGRKDDSNRRWDAHPLVREYFGNKLQAENPKGFRHAHSVLFDYFQSVPKDDLPDTLEKLQPLYRAMHHGCQAGQYKKAFVEIYYRRILRGRAGYSYFQLGAYSSNLAALAGFFPYGWNSQIVDVGLSEGEKYILLSDASLCLMSLGRIAEALGIQQETIQAAKQKEYWDVVAKSATIYNMTLLLAGKLQQVQMIAKTGKAWARKSNDAYLPISLQVDVAAVHCRLGELAESRAFFQEAEKMLAHVQPSYSRLYGVQGKNYCDLLLEQAREPSEWQEVIERAENSFQLLSGQGRLFSIALDHLTQGRAYAAMGQHGTAHEQLNQSVDFIRQSGVILYTPEVLLHRATFLRQQGMREAAYQDVEEALAISVRCGMLLYEADGRLLEGHMFLDVDKRQEATQSLERAEALIEQMAYGQRIAEVQILRTRLWHYQGDSNQANLWKQRAHARIEEKNQWGLLPILERETCSF